MYPAAWASPRPCGSPIPPDPRFAGGTNSGRKLPREVPPVFGAAAQSYVVSTDACWGKHGPRVLQQTCYGRFCATQASGGGRCPCLGSHSFHRLTQRFRVICEEVLSFFQIHQRAARSDRMFQSSHGPSGDLSPRHFHGSRHRKPRPISGQLATSPPPPLRHGLPPGGCAEACLPPAETTNECRAPHAIDVTSASSRATGPRCSLCDRSGRMRALSSTGGVSCTRAILHRAWVQCHI